MNDARRRFSSAERVALYLANSGCCALCGTTLQRGWHADHIVPRARHGETDTINGQSLCPSCNLKKGATLPMSRKWQQTALQKFTASQKQNFLVTATPGAGKTRFALAAARELLEAGTIARILVVCPTRHLRIQWKTAAHKYSGIALDPKFANRDGAVAADVHGVVVTYASVASEPQLYRKIVADRRTMVILDEVHHAGESLSWGNALYDACEPAVRRLLLSGTPFRSDSNEIPFVQYEPDQHGVVRSVADYSYDYGRALNDGVVRPVAFNALDGQAKWRDAGVVIEGNLDNNNEDQAKKALRTVLQPNGAWIGSVLRSADAELSRVREEVPDAGGLIVAPGQVEARAYARLLSEITGESASVAISDEDGASDVITAFEGSQSRWLVAVQMVSEGVDIPRLAVGVYASTISTRMFFRQVVGRFVRTRDGEELCASIFLPSVPVLLAHAAEIEEERDHSLSETIERSERERGEAQPLQLDINVVEPLTSSEATPHGTILSGEVFDDAELARAEEARRAAGVPSSVSTAQIAKLGRLYGYGAETVRVEVPAPATQTSLIDEKAALRKVLNAKVNRYCIATDLKHGQVHGKLNDHFGDRVPNATAETLQKRLDVIDLWLGQA